MNSLTIFISRKEHSFESALRIKKEANIPVEIIYIEDFLINYKNYKFNQDGIVYFLTNERNIAKAIKILDKTGCYIYNKEFLKKGLNKEEVQKILQNSKLNIPKIFSNKEITQEDFPVFCKQKQHTGIAFQAYNKLTITCFFERFNPKNFYLEEAIISNEKSIKEIKVYYVYGNIYYKDGDDYKFNKKIYEISNKIALALNQMELFSVDLILKDKKYYIIDINPASGFYLSSNARKNFLEEINNISVNPIAYTG